MVPFKIYRNQTLYTDYEAAKSAIISRIEGGQIGDGVIAVMTYGDSWENGMSLIAITHNGSYTLMDFNELIRQLESDEKVTASALNDLNKRINASDLKISEVEETQISFNTRLTEDEATLAQTTQDIDDANDRIDGIVDEITEDARVISAALSTINTNINSIEETQTSFSTRLTEDEATLAQATQDIIDANDRIDNVIENHNSLVSELLDDEEIISRSLNDLHARTTDLSSQIDEKADESDVNELRNSKQDTLISGNGISLNNNVVSLTKNTVVLSQSEYDAIPDSEKNTNNVIYFITEES